jgi:hypothetical protein
MTRDQLHQYTPILYGQGVAFESLNQHLAFFVAEFALAGAFHRGRPPLINNTYNKFELVWDDRCNALR